MPALRSFVSSLRLGGTALVLLALAACSEPVVLLSLSVTPPSASIAAGSRQPFIAIAAYSDGIAQDVTAQADWSLSNTDVARFAAEGGLRGVVEGTAEGTVEVTVEFNGKSAKTSLTVTSARLLSLTLSPVKATIGASTTRQFVVTGTYSNDTTQTFIE